MKDRPDIGISNVGMYGKARWSNELLGVLGDHTIHGLAYNVTPDDLDFIIFDGGADIYPHFYGEDMDGSFSPHLKRDFLEQFLFHRYFNTDTKFVGICRGLQFLNVMMNGTLYQNLGDVKKDHKGNHVVNAIESNVKPFVPRRFHVNSLHHQGIKDLGMDLMPTLIEPKTELIEGIESINGNNIRAVQCHPEMGGFKQSDKLMEYLFWMDA